MKTFLLDILVCPFCSGNLKLKNSRYVDKEIESGTLECDCGKAYPVLNYIPRFVDSDSYAKNFSFEWNHFSMTQLDSFNGTRISENRFKEVTGMGPESLAGKIVLEIGCGMGRFLEVAAKSSREVIGIDLSFSVDAARDNLKGFPNVHLVQASVFNLPFRNETFDLIYSIGVLHHTPNPKVAFLNLAPLVSENGSIAIWYSPRPKLTYFPRATYIARLFTTRVNPELLFKVVKGFVPLTLPFVRLPLIGGFLKGWIFPVCDYKRELPLTEEQLLEWSILDTFDLLSPRYLYPRTSQEIKAWFNEAGFSDVVTLKPDVIARGLRRFIDA